MIIVTTGGGGTVTVQFETARKRITLPAGSTYADLWEECKKWRPAVANGHELQHAGGGKDGFTVDERATVTNQQDHFAIVKIS